MATIALGGSLLCGCTPAATRHGDWTTPREPLQGAAPALGIDRGVHVCDEHRPCPDPRALGAANPPRAGTDLPRASFRFERVTPDGARKALHNGTALGFGDRFIIRVSANQASHVYLWHLSPQGALVELIATSRPDGLTAGCNQTNRIAPGQSIQLPGLDTSYGLDDARGSERFFALACATPLCPTPGAGQASVAPVGRPCFRCPDAGTECAEDFVIQRARGT